MLVTVEEVGRRNRTTYTGDDLIQVESFIQDISAAIETYTKRTFADPVPEFIKAVALLEVRRLINSEPGIKNERIAELSTTYEFTALLSNSAKADLRAYLRWTSPAASYIRLFSPNYRGSCLPVPTVEASLDGTDVMVSGRTAAEGLAQIQHSDDGFVWVDLAYTTSSDISDGGLPYFRGVLVSPEPGNYKFRARWRYDAETSGWSKPKSLEVT